VSALAVMGWIAARAEHAPPTLVVRVGEVLAAHPEVADGSVAEALLAMSDLLLEAAMTTGDGEARDAALDLLAADACVTWAFEAAADEPGTILERAEAAMRRIAAAAA
jgi:hypothetical protein